MNDEAADEDDELIEQILRKGKVVFSHDWNSGGPGAGAGSEQVRFWNGMYAVHSLDSGNAGPFASLDEGLQEQDLLEVTNATTAIHCSMLSAKDLAKRLNCCLDVDLLHEDGIEENRFEIKLNGEAWVYRAKTGNFKRKRGKR